MDCKQIKKNFYIIIRIPMCHLVLSTSQIFDMGSLHQIQLTIPPSTIDQVISYHRQSCNINIENILDQDA